MRAIPPERVISSGSYANAWQFDGTRESIQGALDLHPELEFIGDRRVPYLLFYNRGGYHTVNVSEWIIITDQGLFRTLIDKKYRTNCIKCRDT